MTSQRGSMLVATLGIGLTMTAAAAGLMLLSGTVQQLEQVDQQDAQLLLLAESGAQMGVRWLRVHHPSNIAGKLVANTEVTGGFTTPSDFTGYSLRVTVTAMAPAVTDTFYAITSRATRTAGSDTVMIMWNVVHPFSSETDAQGTVLTKFGLANWRESHRPYQSP